MLEDRLRSFLYYIGALRRADDPKLNIKQTKSILRQLYFCSEEASYGQRIDLNQISTKENLIRSTLIWAIEYVGVPEETYLAALKSEYEGLDIVGLLTTLDQIDVWREYRNEIIHGLLNKNATSVDAELKSKVEDGMKYARFIDSQVKLLKKKNIANCKCKLDTCTVEIS